MNSLLCFFSAAFLSATCSAGEAGEAPAQKACGRYVEDGTPTADAGDWRIQAGPVTWTQGDPPQVTGTFEVCAASGEDPPGGALRQGGACLVADLVPWGIGRASCATHADCNAFDGKDPRMAGYVGYCATQDGSGEPPRCWTRPGPASTHCRRSADGFPLTVGTHGFGPVSGDPQGAGAPYPRWAVFACLAQAGHDRACGDPDSPNKQISLTPRH